MVEILKPSNGSKPVWARSAVPVMALLTFLSGQGAPWWGLLIAGVVLTLGEQLLRPSVARKDMPA